jgi:hypothetical protein
MTLRSLAFAASISFATLAVTDDSPAAEPDSNISVISHYVISRKHWSRNIFRVERTECDCSYALYRVIYLPEADKPVTANSKSFAVYYDEERHRVIKETQFQ